MAEIKSTMDMVMERAARIAAGTEIQADSEETQKIGMRLAADFLNGKIADLAAALNDRKQAEQPAVRKGMTETLLRNITLPRDEQIKSTGLLAIKGVLSLVGTQLSPLCSELQQILEQYGQHKEQTTQQLEEAIRAQLGQMGRRGGQAQQGAALNPALHPQYREELARMLSDLNTQYSQALDQRKDMLRQAIDRLR
jgi:hypothetical protein